MAKRFSHQYNLINSVNDQPDVHMQRTSNGSCGNGCGGGDDDDGGVSSVAIS